jgi:hypothetical protein
MDADKNLKWFGQTVGTFTDLPLDSVLLSLPEFVREPFGDNEHQDVIIRQPFRDDSRVIPVASVSKSYSLVQHTDIIKALATALADCQIDPKALTAELMLSEYGERMCLDVRIPKFDFNPGDGHNIAMHVTCMNSVDKSCALEIIMQWKRLVCRNGMVRAARSNLRRIHNTDWLSIANINQYLRQEFATAPGDVGVYTGWKKHAITMPMIETWADEVLNQAWGVHAAARACHIAKTGYDGQIEDPFEKAPPHEKRVTSECEVPGSCAPVSNVFHLSQVLSWIASHRNSIEDRMVKTREIYGLIEPLISGL